MQEPSSTHRAGSLRRARGSATDDLFTVSILAVWSLFRSKSQGGVELMELESTSQSQDRRLIIVHSPKESL